MKKRFLAIFLAMVMCLTLLPTAALAAGGDFAIENGVLTKYNGPGGAVTISNGVTSIGDRAFEGCTGLISVTIPDSVTEIESNAFQDCTGLTSVTIPDSITSIGDRAFEGCTGLISVTIGNGVTSIGEYAFSSCVSLTSTAIGSSVTSIGDRAFEGCNSLTSVAIPGSVASIGGYVFEGCNALKDIYYGGTEAQWKAIEIENGNFKLISGTIQYNSTGSDQPSTLPTVENIPVTGTAVAQPQNVLLDGKTVQFQYYALKDANGNDTNYVKLRDVAYALSGTAAQFSVGWDQAAKSISVTSGEVYESKGSEMKTPYSGDRAYTASTSPLYINGKAANLGAILLTDDAGNGYTYYKLRDLGQLLNFNVTWNGSSIVVESDKPYTG